MIDYNGRRFVSIENTDNGEVSSKTIFDNRHPHTRDFSRELG